MTTLLPYPITEGCKLLVIDDQSANLKFLVNYLVEQGFRVLTARNGSSGIKRAQYAIPDLILLDMMMPGMNGIETCRELKADEATKNIPVIFMTALADVTYKAKGFEVGAVDYITKPFQLEEVLIRIHTHLRIRDLTHNLEQLVAQRTVALEQARKEADEARIAAEKANHAKSLFLANMSHELRTPLAAIIGYSELLEEQSLTANYDAFTPRLQKIQISANHLLDMISDILDISKIEAGHMRIYRETFAIRPLIDNLLITAIPLIERNGNEMILTCDADLGMMYADIPKVRQILLNLLANAAKFTKNGRITFTVERQTNEANEPWLVCHVADTGVGMTPAQIETIFEAFVQADTSTTREYGGTGLGLAICQRFCQMMGGVITVESALNNGSIFTLRLPIVEAPKATAITTIDPPDIEPDFSKRAPATVLVIDDEPVIRDLIMSHLSEVGVTIKTAVNGTDGIKQAHLHKPDIILLDILMPDIDGWAVLSELQADDTLRHIPILMLSLLQEQEKSITLGATDYITKPISGKQLRAIIHKYLPHRTPDMS